MKTCKICIASQQEKGPDVIEVGKVYLMPDNTLNFDVESGYEELMGEVTKFPDKDQKKWFEDLPLKYRGTYMWAEMAK